MTVKELINALASMPPEARIYIGRGIGHLAVVDRRALPQYDLVILRPESHES